MAMMAGAAFAIMELIVRSTTVARVCMRLNRVANFSISCQVLSLKVEVLWIESDQHWSDGPDSSHIIVLGKLLVQVQRSNGISRRAGHPHRDTWELAAVNVPVKLVVCAASVNRAVSKDINKAAIRVRPIVKLSLGKADKPAKRGHL